MKESVSVVLILFLLGICGCTKPIEEEKVDIIKITIQRVDMEEDGPKRIIKNPDTIEEFLEFFSNLQDQTAPRTRITWEPDYVIFLEFELGIAHEIAVSDRKGVWTSGRGDNPLDPAFIDFLGRLR